MGGRRLSLYIHIRRLVMKKFILVISAIIFCFAAISCDNGSSGDSSNDVTVKQLIEKMPMSIEEYEKNSKGRTARTAAPVDFENEEGIKPLHFNNITEEFSYLRIFMTILKNDVINYDGLDFDENIDISSVKIKSAVSKEFIEKNLGGNPEQFFDNLGTMNISVKNDIVSVYWSLDIFTGDDAHKPLVFNLYIKGTWSNEAYDDFFCGLKYKVNSNDGVYDWFELESYKTEGSKVIQEIASIRADGPYAKRLTEKQGENWVQYNLGGTEIVLNPDSETLAALQNARSIRFKDSTGVADFMYGNGRRKPDFYLYDIYDLDGYLVFEQEKRNDGYYNDVDFRQYIPLKYLRSSKDVVKNADGKYYFADDTEQPVNIEEVEFEVSYGEDNHKYYPCYAMHSDSPSEITMEEPFSFTKKEYTLVSIAKLQEYVERSYSKEFMKELVSQKEINSIKEKIETWLATVSE